MQPLPATRTPDERGQFEYGVHLRLPGGPVLRHDDPLLAMYGALTGRVGTSCTNPEALQLDPFDAGRRVRLEIELDEDGDAIVAVWDEEGIRRGGVFRFEAECPIVAALDHGLPLEGLVLREHVDAATRRRTCLDVLVYARAFVDVHVPEDLVVERPERTRATRVVLFADGRGELCFWDPAGHAGPGDPGDLPLSPRLVDELAILRERYRQLARRSEESANGLEQMTCEWGRAHLDRRMEILWRRARQELGRSYAVGFQGPGMPGPIWSPRELVVEDDDDEEEIPF